MSENPYHLGVTTAQPLSPMECAREVAKEVAAAHADEVDRDARFPHEAIDALRARRLLAAVAPPALGGLGCAARKLADIAETLAEGCAATAMIWSMHQIQLACLVRHGRSDYLRDLVGRVCSEQMLLASATSEVGVGGDIRKSRAAFDPCGGIAEKDASTISYGAHSDIILATLRRNLDAAPNDQILVVMLTAETRMVPLSGWDALGMRGTCSSGFRISAQLRQEQVIPDPFERIASTTMVFYSHLLWAACWNGIASAALSKARRYLRMRERKSPGGNTLSIARLAEASARLRMVRAAVAEAAEAFDRCDGDLGDHWSLAMALNDLKLSVSRTAVRVTQDALSICGFAGYMERDEQSVARHVRDALSGPLMVANDRLVRTNGGLLLSHKETQYPW